MPNTNDTVNPLAKQAMDKMKVEVADELGIQDYDKIDKGQLSSRQNGYVGGNMVKKMIGMAEEVMAKDKVSTEQVANNDVELETPKDNQ
jgi:hypothetical protein